MDLKEVQSISGRRFDIKLFTSIEEYSVADTVYHVSGSTTGTELNQLVNSLLEETNNDWEPIDFDFVVEGVLLRQTIEDHLELISQEKGDFISSEKELSIEYVSKQTAPKPSNSLLHDDWVSAIAGSNEFILSGCYDGSAHIWNYKGDHQIAIPAHDQAAIKAVSWISSQIMNSNDDKFFVTASQDEQMNIFKWTPGSNKVTCIFTCKGHSRSVDCVDVNQDLIASGSYDNLLKIWSVNVDEENGEDASTSGIKKRAGKKAKGNDGNSMDVPKIKKTLTPLVTLLGHTQAITDVTWLSSQGSETVAPEVASCSMDNTIKIWDIEISRMKQTMVGSKAILSLSFSPLNNLFVTGSSDRHIRLWDPRVSDETNVISNFSSHTGWVPAVDWSVTSSQHFISGSYDGSVKHWDIRSPKASLYDLLGHKDKVLDVNWSNPQFIVSGSCDNQVKIFSA